MKSLSPLWMAYIPTSPPNRLSYVISSPLLIHSDGQSWWENDGRMTMDECEQVCEGRVKGHRFSGSMAYHGIVFIGICRPKTLFCATGALFGEVANQPGTFFGLQVDCIFSTQELDVSLGHKLDLGQGAGGFLHTCPTL